MRYFLDAEFIEEPCTIKLLSLAIVAEDGRELYLETPLAYQLANGDAEAPEWIMQNVVPYLGRVEPTGTCLMAHEIKAFVGDKPEFWGYYCDYDWVVFCWIFGKMIDLPKGFPMYCLDLKQWADDLGGVRLPKQTQMEHHALVDARWNRDSYNFLWNCDPRKL